MNFTFLLVVILNGSKIQSRVVNITCYVTSPRLPHWLLFSLSWCILVWLKNVLHAATIQCSVSFYIISLYCIILHNFKGTLHVHKFLCIYCYLSQRSEQMLYFIVALLSRFRKLHNEFSFFYHFFYYFGKYLRDWLDMKWRCALYITLERRKYRFTFCFVKKKKSTFTHSANTSKNRASSATAILFTSAGFSCYEYIVSCVAPLLSSWITSLRRILSVTSSVSFSISHTVSTRTSHIHCSLRSTVTVSLISICLFVLGCRNYFLISAFYRSCIFSQFLFFLFVWFYLLFFLLERRYISLIFLIFMNLLFHFFSLFSTFISNNVCCLAAKRKGKKVFTHLLLCFSL